jgi:RHH-type rel operon transcriptional repressor/antitoxin RelB
MASVSLRLPDEISQRLEHLAELTGRSKTYYMIEAIREHLDDLEDLYLAEQRLIDLRAGKTRAVPLEVAIRKTARAVPLTKAFRGKSADEIMEFLRGK